MTQPNLNEARRRANNKLAVLAFLRERGTRGATNVELVEIGGMRAVGGRLTELRAEGHDVETIREGGGLFRFVLHEPARTAGVQPGQPGYLSSLPVVASITGRAIPARAVPADSDPAATGRLF